MAINPQIIKSYAAKEYDRTKSLMFKSARFSFYLLFIMALPMLCETDFVLTLWLKIVPDNTVIFVRIMIGCILLWTFTNPMCTVADATGNIKRINLTHSFIVVLALPASWIVLKCGAPAYSAFLLVLLSEIISAIVRLYILRSLTGFSVMSFIKEVFFRAFLVACISSILPIVLCLTMDSSLLRLVLTILLSVICVITIGYIIGITKEERLFINQKIQAITKKH